MSMKKLFTLFTIVSIVCVFNIKSAASQQLLPPGQLMLAGVPVVCGAVPTLIQPIQDVAMARPGIIILSPGIFSLPPVIQVFIYAHECGHHIVGNSESDADCWAIQTGRNQGWFSADDFRWLILYFGRSPGDWTHAPGPQRLQYMEACYNT